MNDGEYLFFSSPLLLFGRYVFPPDRLGYCGPDSVQGLFEYVSSERTDRGLVELERRFGALIPACASSLARMASLIPSTDDDSPGAPHQAWMLAVEWKKAGRRCDRRQRGVYGTGLPCFVRQM